ncbi:1,4-alpha-glucan branching protein GlgB [uncultured Stenotrophomonas sp.]|uniref:1,4-alpha-glucan branching protein GlgB n=1 Tax=uncultured Stenotrophomonas sp. TaxID=165438 RepID=UPI0028E1E8B6|nr:1,4-alpha-glucan branching protein GlgB [uncultured Stenotrophomonas sp.]
MTEDALIGGDGVSVDDSLTVPVGPEALTPALADLVAGRPCDAFAVLGPHRDGAGWRHTVYLPGATRVDADLDKGAWRSMQQSGHEGLFQLWTEQRGSGLLRIHWSDGVQEIEDAYAFGIQLADSELDALRGGDPDAARRSLGAVTATCDGVAGVRFTVWAPTASRVAVVGDFNGWDVRRHPMRLRHDAGVWELFLPRVKAGTRYKFALTAGDGHTVVLKADPMARACEMPPDTASRVSAPCAHAWKDAGWMQDRALAAGQAISVYEVHAGSWQRHADGAPLDWAALGDRLIPYVTALGFTHIELLPVSEHPFGGSWGYQPLGLYAPTARYGRPQDFAAFVDRCHGAGLGVIVDWVGAHFPTDAHGMNRFDGTALYEHEDPRLGLHPDWNTLIYNYGRAEVAAFLIGSALEWIDRFHVDGLRVDAVASMLYRDYSRAEGEWLPNVNGGRENLEAVAFLRQLNDAIRARFPDVLVMAEESTAWPGVTAPTAANGLGFTHKWNMGWMHDTLAYLQRDPIHRGHHHGEMTFSAIYAFSERFILPLSHDEVVHGKGSLLAKMPGDRSQQLANLRACYGFMWAHPGSKLLFMGGEFAQPAEWNHDAALDWDTAADPAHAGVARLVGDLNRLLQQEPSLRLANDSDAGFEWSVSDDHRNSVLAFVRHAPDGTGRSTLVVCNFTPVARHGYLLGVPSAGAWSEMLNTDSAHYGGGNLGNAGRVNTIARPMHGHAQSLPLTLPPLSVIYLQAAE